MPLPRTLFPSSEPRRGLMARAALAALVALAWCIPAQSLAQDLFKKAPKQAQPIVIENAMIVPVVGDVIDKGYVYFNDGVIVGVGAMPLPRFDAPVKIIDGTGKRVYPGLISAYSQIGLIEVAAVRATLDMGEVAGGGLGTPEARAAVAVNPDSALLPVARSNGVLIAGVFPQNASEGMLAYFSGPGGLVPGRASVMRLEGWTWEDMAINAEAGVVVNWPFPRPLDAWWMNRSRDDQQKDIDRAIKALDDLFSAARAYADLPSDQPRQMDVRYEAMRPVFRSRSAADAKPAVQRPVFIQANDIDAILQAAAFCDKHELRCVIVGGRDALLAADVLKQRSISVLLAGTYNFPKRDDQSYASAYDLGARLESAGVSWCITSSEEAANERNLPYAAALAVAHGLDARIALEAITIRPARILGIDKAYGSIEPGKSATLIMTTGDVLEITSNVIGAFIDGRELELADKHKALAEKYRERYRQLGSAGQPQPPPQNQPQNQPQPQPQNRDTPPSPAPAPGKGPVTAPGSPPSARTP
jgi:imidazolonepropionase-like amidohydrolase